MEVASQPPLAYTVIMRAFLSSRQERPSVHWLAGEGMPIPKKVWSSLLFFRAVDPYYVFGHTGSRSVSILYGSGSLHQQAKYFLFLFDYLSL
jgi:hypothetical protein